MVIEGNSLGDTGKGPNGPQGIYLKSSVQEVSLRRNTSLVRDDFPYTVTEEDNVLIDSTVTNNSDVVNTSGAHRKIEDLDNLEGTSADDIVDASGKLTGAYTMYLGTRGFQIQ